MSKIKVSAVEIKAPAEAIVLNSSFVAKAVRAADVAQRLQKHMDEYCPTLMEQPDDADAEPVEKGKNWAEWKYRSFNADQLGTETVADVYEKLVPFVEELCDALLGEEK